MRHIGGELFLEISDLEKAGVSYARVAKARERGSAGWTIIDDPADRRRVLVKYADLKSTVKAVVDAVHGQAVSNSRAGLWVSLVTVEAADLSVLRSHPLPDGSTLSEKVVAEYARACAFLRLLRTVTRTAIASWGYSGSAEFHADVCARIKQEALPLPIAYTKLKAKVRDFAVDGAVCIISKKWGNQNSRKIETAQSAWLIAEYAQPTKPDTHKVATKYQAVAKANGWPALTETAIYMHLNRTDIVPLWTVGRHGTTSWKNTFAHTMSLHGPSFRDALWVSDGTKLNYFYQDEKGIRAMMKVYLIMDTYSEAIVGWSFSDKEDFKAQFAAAKMALQLSKQKPLQWLYDNQSGHNAKDSQDFYTRATKLHFPAQPYNAKSKPIENMIGRLQKQVMRERWFFTGMNVRSKTENSRPNMEFITKHRHALLSLEEVKRAAQEDVMTWNDTPHPKTGIARMAMYQDSVCPMAQPLDFMDFMELFWITSQRPVTYTNQGLIIEVSGHRLKYEVYDSEGVPSMEFLRRWTNAKFTAKYDPENLAAGVYLFRTDDSGELRRVARADVKKTYARAAVDLKPGERAEIDNNLALRKAQEELIKKELDELRNVAGIDPDTLVEVGYRGENKPALNHAQEQLLLNNRNDDEPNLTVTDML